MVDQALATRPANGAVPAPEIIESVIAVGDLRKLSPAQRGRLLNRLVSKIDIVLDGSGCWEWRGARTANGYGIFKAGRLSNGHAQPEYVHRLMYVLRRGPLPAGAAIDHLCRNRACVNPSHLEAVTPYENWKRGQSPGARLERAGICGRGHERSPENWYRYPDGRGECRLCRAIRWQRFAAKRRAA